MSVEIVPGSRLSLHLSLTLEDGSEAFSTFGEEPLQCTLGDGTLRPGLELALYGLRSGDTQTLTLTPEQAYGLHDPELVHAMPLGDFPDGLAPQVGQVLGFALPDGEETAGLVRAVGESTATVDFNNPLAGHELVFRVEILDVENAA